MACTDGKNTYLNIKELPEITYVTSGDLLIVETSTETSIINVDNFILEPANTSFAADHSLNISINQTNINTLSAQLYNAEVKSYNLETKIQSLCAALYSEIAESFRVAGASLPPLANIRLSLHPTMAVPTMDLSGSDANTLYIHPYRGDTVALYNTVSSRWVAHQINSTIAVKLSTDLTVADAVYDIYLSVVEGEFVVSFTPWNSLQVLSLNTFNQPTPVQDIDFTASTKYLDGFIVNPVDYSRRLIGCIKTVAPGESKFSYGFTTKLSGSEPTFYLWNAYNQVPITFGILEKGKVGGGGYNTWRSTPAGATAISNGPLEPFGGLGNRVNFINREPCTIDISSEHTALSAVCWYFAYSLDATSPMVSAMRIKTPGITISETCLSGGAANSYHQTIKPGNHYIQLVSMTYSSDYQEYMTWPADSSRHSYGTSGSFLLF